MFYNVGKASLAMGQRRKEIRSERAAIREEFERWKASNPYATAMDFHAKVKQLGSTTPGGSVALPDGMSIQRMAADNLRKKQEDELREQRRRQAEDLDIQVKRTTFVRQMIKDTNGQKDPEDLLSAAGMEVNTDNLKWARGLQASIVEENERISSQRAADNAYRWTSQFNQWRSDPANRYLSDDRFPGYNYLSETGMAPQTMTAQSTPSASSGRSPAVVSDAGPVMPSPAPASAPASAPTSAASSATSQVPVDLRLQLSLNADMQGIYQKRPDNFLGPNGLETLQQTAISVARAGGSQASDAAIIAALKDTEFYRSYETELDTETFKAGLLVGRPANQMAISVGEGKDAQSIKLEDILTDEVNNTGIFNNRVVPAYAVDEFAAIMRPYFVMGDGGITMTPNITEQQLAELEAQLNSAGIYDTSQVARQRDQILRQEKTFTSVNDLLADQGAEIAQMQEALVAEVKAAGNTLYARKQAAEQRAGQLMRFKAMTAANDPVAIYAAGGAYALDLLPASEHQAYNPAAAAALYDDAINAILEAANDPSLEVDPTEQAEIDRQATETDRVIDLSDEIVTDATVSAAVEALGGYGIGVEFSTDSSGQSRRSSIGRTPLSRELLQGSPDRQQAVVRAMASAFDAFEAQRGTGLQNTPIKNKKGLLPIFMAMVAREVTAQQQAWSQFPGYNRAIADAESQFATALNMSSVFTSSEVTELQGDFKKYISQATRQHRFIAEDAFGATPRIKNVTQMDIFGADDSGLPEGARLVPGN